MRPIDADKLLKEYDRLHKGPPGAARKMIEDAPTINGAHCATGAGCWLERNKDIILQAGREGREVDFYLNGRLFRIREVAQ